MKQRNPMQPVINTDSGVIRFKKNKIVDELLDFASARGFDLNFIVGKLCKGDFSQDDYEQFNQLIGYSVNGFHELSNVSDATARQASRLAKKIDPEAGGCRDGGLRKGCGLHVGVERRD
jgi:hypothetical protein